MSKLLSRFKSSASKLATTEIPLFYSHCAQEIRLSKEMHYNHPLILRCKEDVLPFLSDSFGHGIDHCQKVAIDAAAIVLLESRENNAQAVKHLAMLAQLCGLLHDTCRLDPEHARKGADLALDILTDYPLDQEDKKRIAFAISNHEAFHVAMEPPDERSSLLDGSLFDADKFRWGPDNFTTTLWEICNYQEWPLEEIVHRFPHGLSMLQAIKTSFRTDTGKAFGPEFIDLGLVIGSKIYRELKLFCEKHQCAEA